jgi:hypothetical protein
MRRETRGIPAEGNGDNEHQQTTTSRSTAPPPKALPPGALRPLGAPKAGKRTNQPKGNLVSSARDRAAANINGARKDARTATDNQRSPQTPSVDLEPPARINRNKTRPNPKYVELSSEDDQLVDDDGGSLRRRGRRVDEDEEEEEERRGHGQYSRRKFYIIPLLFSTYTMS